MNEITMTALPELNSREVLILSCAEMVPLITDWLNGSPHPQMIDQLVECVSEDGFTFARKLHERGYFIPDAELVDILNGFSTYRGWKSSRKAWVEKNKVVVDLELNQRVTVMGKPGIVQAIHKSTAEIVFLPDEEREQYPNGGWFTLAEEVTPLGEAQ